MGETKQSKTQSTVAERKSQSGIRDGFGAPVTGITLRTQVGKCSETHLDKGSFDIVIHKEMNEGTTRRGGQRI